MIIGPIELSFVATSFPLTDKLQLLSVRAPLLWLDSFLQTIATMPSVTGLDEIFSDESSFYGKSNFQPCNLTS